MYLVSESLSTTQCGSEGQGQSARTSTARGPIITFAAHYVAHHIALPLSNALHQLLKQLRLGFRQLVGIVAFAVRQTGVRATCEQVGHNLEEPRLTRPGWPARVTLIQAPARVSGPAQLPPIAQVITPQKRGVEEWSGVRWRSTTQ